MSTLTAVGTVDHLVVAAPDLAEAVSHWRDTTGTTPVAGGRHEGMGSMNALVGLDHGRYVEIVAPDPSSPTTADTERALSLPGPVLYNFAVLAMDLDALARGLTSSGLSLEIVEVTRRAPDGSGVSFRYAPVAGHDLGPAVPFFIEWGETAHPTSSLEAVCSLLRTAITHPHVSELDRVLSRLGISGIQTSAGPAVELEAVLDTPRGRRVLHSVATAIAS